MRSPQWVEHRTKQREVDFGPGTANTVPLIPNMNRVPIQPVDEAGFHHMDKWVREGTPPPIQPRIEFDGETVVRDQLGIARGGIRLPQVEVPLARHDAIPLGLDWLSFVSGSSTPLSPLGIAVYGDEDSYMKRFEEAAAAAVEVGVLLERDAKRLIDEARHDYRAATAI